MNSVMLNLRRNGDTPIQSKSLTGSPPGSLRSDGAEVGNSLLIQYSAADQRDLL